MIFCIVAEWAGAFLFAFLISQLQVRTSFKTCVIARSHCIRVSHITFGWGRIPSGKQMQKRTHIAKSSRAQLLSCEKSIAPTILSNASATGFTTHTMLKTLRRNVAGCLPICRPLSVNVSRCTSMRALFYKWTYFGISTPAVAIQKKRVSWRICC